MSSGLLHDVSISDAVQGAAAMPSIPREAILDTVPRSALAATKKIVNLVPITSNTATSNQTIQFLIPQRNMMKASSMYLKFELTVSGAAARFSFSGMLASAAALINNITIQAGGVVLESLQNYHLWHNNVLAYAQQGDDQLAVEQLCSGTKLINAASGAFSNAQAAASNNYTQDVVGYSSSAIAAGGNVGGASATNATFANCLQFSTAAQLNKVVFTIPILAGVFNPKESQLVPLQFINGGILLTIQTNPVSKAFI